MQTRALICHPNIWRVCVLFFEFIPAFRSFDGGGERGAAYVVGSYPPQNYLVGSEYVSG